MNSQRVGVVGLGLLGRGIVGCFLGHGFQVVALSRSEEKQGIIQGQIEKMIRELVEFGGFDATLQETWQKRFVPTTNYIDLSDSSIVVESVIEDADVKQAVFDQIEANVPDSTIIASNSSAIPISRLQQSRKHPERFLAMHWAEPAHATRFMEIIRGELTSEQTIQTTLMIARKLGKEPSLLQKDIPGFIVNRIGYAMYREALSLVESGIADIETVDRSVRNALGLWATVCGPFRWMDLTGGPELYTKAMQQVLPTLNNSHELSSKMRKLAESGARGILSGHGFYDYKPDEAKQWEDLYRHHAWRVTQMQNEYFPLSTD